jgi:hypothetical protein
MASGFTSTASGFVATSAGEAKLIDLVKPPEEVDAMPKTAP